MTWLEPASTGSGTTSPSGTASTTTMGWLNPAPAAKKAPAPDAGKTPAPSGAHVLLNQFLQQFGLGALADWAWKTYTNAGGGDLGMQLVQAELPQQAAFKTRFPAIAQRVAKGLPAISPTDYLNYETTLRQAFSAHGLPLPDTGPAFENMITKLLVNDVSAAEVVNQRIGTAFDRVANAPLEVKQAAYNLWGVNGDSALAAAFLDPSIDAAKLDRMSQSAEIQGTATRFGIDINADRAARLQTLGADQNLGQFAKVAQLDPLFHANIGEDPSLTIEGAGVSAAFGEDAASAAAVARRLALRKASFQGGGGPYQQSSVSSTPGVSGLGSGPT